MSAPRLDPPALPTHLPRALVGVLGGSGLYQMDALQGAREVTLDTPYGRPSDALVTGAVHGVPVVFLARHGRGHRLLPSEVPYRANLYALKMLGVKYLLSLSAVGSLREEFKRLDMVLPDQFMDFTRQRASSFFGQGAVAHVSMAQPVCAATADALGRAVQQVLAQEQAHTGADPGVTLHKGGTYVCMEGPQFSSLAESQMYRTLGGGVIGMTNLPEAKLAREAQMAYATLAMVTDYDCWHPREAHVTATMALENLFKNAGRAQLIAAEAIRLLGQERPASEAHTALAQSLVTQPDAMAPDVRERVAVLLA
ncbi:MAG: S-methyl-5'-thioadenosine phosphorylase [Polaromonas sp.]|nr:S-methyl-5'-thioadenosine phosphorylase [Polaromonas sp.]